MATFDVKPGSLLTKDMDYLLMLSRISSIRDELGGIKVNLNKCDSMELIMSRIAKEAESIGDESKKLTKMRSSLMNIVSKYCEADKKAAENVFSVVDGVAYTATEAIQVYEEPKWDRMTNVEYALLCSYCNDVADRYENEKGMEDHFWESLQNLPPNDPLRHISRDKIKAYRYDSGLEAIVIEIDENSAIVIFSGTQGDSLEDISGDVGLVTYGSAGLQDNHANDLINNLPYDNITVTGHSLGGYLAADVTLNNSKVDKCVTFDAPGHKDQIVATQAEKDSIPWINQQIEHVSVNPNASKITNIRTNGSGVSWTGHQVGSNTYNIDVHENGSLVTHNHDINAIVDSLAGFGGESTGTFHESGAYAVIQMSYEE